MRKHFRIIQKLSLIVILIATFSACSSGGGGGTNDGNNIQDSSSSLHWAKSYGGYEYDYPSSIQQTNDSGFIVAGATRSFGVGYDDMWILKLSSYGEIEWQKSYGGFYIDVANSIRQTIDGGYIVAGYTYSFGSDFWILKLNFDGSIAWQKVYDGCLGSEAISILQTSDGNYIVGGRTCLSSTTDIWLLKLDSSGSIIWQKSYGGEENDSVSSIIQTIDGGFIISGNSESFSYGSGPWLLKLDSRGDIEWQKSYRELGINSYAEVVAQTSDGGYTLSGETVLRGGDLLVMKLDLNGDILWQKSYGGDYLDGGSSVSETNSGDYIVSGITYSFSEGSSDIWLLKLNSSGDIIWQKTYGGTERDVATSMQYTQDGELVIAGYTWSYGVDQRDYWILRLDYEGMISDSNAGRNSSATAQNTSLVASDTTIVPTDSAASITDTTVIGINTNATIRTQVAD
ncbi:MAG: hypothetical protein HZB61_13575 [Nitrospirae bacterium]|nr:hypothetical protein [Nitrospirota bacterium]